MTFIFRYRFLQTPTYYSALQPGYKTHHPECAFCLTGDHNTQALEKLASMEVDVQPLTAVPYPGGIAIL